MKNVLVIGGSGFVGKAVVRSLEKKTGLTLPCSIAVACLLQAPSSSPLIETALLLSAAQAFTKPGDLMLDPTPVVHHTRRSPRLRP
jgi:nucleoside-diphosphate-sugar epimerase